MHIIEKKSRQFEKIGLIFFKSETYETQISVRILHYKFVFGGDYNMPMDYTDRYILLEYVLYDIKQYKY